MNRTFRTVSAFMRHTWCIEPVFAEQHLPLVNAYLNGQLSLNAFDDEDSNSEADDEGNSVSRRGYAIVAANGETSASAPAANQTRYALDDPDLPEGSVFVMDIRGVIVKESTCCSMGTEDYCSMLEQAYANDRIIGNVVLVDSPGGMLSGTPTLYDLMRDPRKPTVTVVKEGLMASAAYWLACGSDFIYASQKTDQIGSIGVYLSFKDVTEQNAREGVRTITIYSDRSPQKNKPFKDALAGDETLIKEDLNQAADLFHEAVKEGRGDRIKPVKKGGPDVFEGGLFYAGKAIELGLIDGYGNVDTAIAKVVDLHNARHSTKSGSAIAVGASLETAPAPLIETTPAPPIGAADPQELLLSNPDNDMFGFTKLPALAALQGIAADAVTEEQITAANAELTAGGYNVQLVSEAQFSAAQTLQTQLNTATSQIETLTTRVAELGAQPGVLPTQVPKGEEQTGSIEKEQSFFSETDAELARQKAGRR